jgi:hypothetical protein
LVTPACLGGVCALTSSAMWSISPAVRLRAIRLSRKRRSAAHRAADLGGNAQRVAVGVAHEDASTTFPSSGRTDASSFHPAAGKVQGCAPCRRCIFPKETGEGEGKVGHPVKATAFMSHEWTCAARKAGRPSAFISS